MPLMRAALAALILALGAGAALAQIVPSQQGTQKPAASSGTTRTTGGGGGAAVAGCYDVLFTIAGKWDPWPGKRGNVDPVIVEQTTGARVACVDTPTCTLRVNGAGAKMSFVIEDDDFDAPDPIASGTCTSGRSCKLGDASITMSAC